MGEDAITRNSEIMLSGMQYKVTESSRYVYITKSIKILMLNIFGNEKLPDRVT